MTKKNPLILCAFSLISSLPTQIAFAEETLYWQSDGIFYLVDQKDKLVTVEIQKEDKSASLLLNNQDCRRGLMLPLQLDYEKELLKQDLIVKAKGNKGPIIDFEMQIDNIVYNKINESRIKCHAMVIDDNTEQNLDRITFEYGVDYLNQRKWKRFEIIADHLIDRSAYLEDIAEIVTGTLTELKTAKAIEYFNDYVDLDNLSSEEVRVKLSNWIMLSGDFRQASSLIDRCSSRDCKLMRSKIELQKLASDQVADLEVNRSKMSLLWW